MSSRCSRDSLVLQLIFSSTLWNEPWQLFTDSTTPTALDQPPVCLSGLHPLITPDLKRHLQDLFCLMHFCETQSHCGEIAEG